MDPETKVRGRGGRLRYETKIRDSGMRPGQCIQIGPARQRWTQRQMQGAEVVPGTVTSAACASLGHTEIPGRGDRGRDNRQGVAGIDFSDSYRMRIWHRDRQGQA